MEPANAPRLHMTLTNLRTMQERRTGPLAQRQPRTVVSAYLSCSCTHGLLIAMAGLCIDRGGEPAIGVGVDPHVSEDEATKAGEASPRSSEEGYIYPYLQTSLDSETLRQLRAEWRSSRKRRKRGLPETTGTTKGPGRLHHEAAFK